MAKKGRYFLFGGLVGAIIALLFSPKNGKEMRESVLESTRNIVNNPEDFKDDIKCSFRKLLDYLKDRETINQPEEEIIISKNFNKEEN